MRRKKSGGGSITMLEDAIAIPEETLHLCGVVVDSLPFADEIIKCNRAVRLVFCIGSKAIGECDLPDNVLPAAAELGDELLITFAVRTCRKCGCTSAKSCMPKTDSGLLNGGCHWIEVDLCSNCG